MQLQEDIYTSGGVQTHTLCPMMKTYTKLRQLHETIFRTTYYKNIRKRI